MISLQQIEHHFQAYLLSEKDDIYQYIVSTDTVPADIRLEIYKNAYHARLQEALATSYPVLQHVFGNDGFETLCYDYIKTHPSHYRSIRWFGDKLSAFLSQHAHYQNLPYLAELALLEWTMALVFDAADCNVVTIEEIAAIAPEKWANMRFKAHPSIHRLNLSWNVVPIWQAITDKTNPPTPEKNASSIHWILWRKTLTSQFSSLTEDEAWAIDAMLNHATFGELCEGLCQWMNEEQVGLHAASLLKGWIQSGLITELVIK